MSLVEHAENCEFGQDADFMKTMPPLSRKEKLATYKPAFPDRQLQKKCRACDEMRATRLEQQKSSMLPPVAKVK